MPVSGTYFCLAPPTTGTFSVSVNLSQTSASTGNGQGTFTCSADGSASAWTLIINATAGAYMTGKASAFLTVNDPNGDFARTISGTDQISISSSTEGVEVPVPTGP